MIIKTLDGIKWILRVISCAMICMLTLIVTMQVLNRNFFGGSFTWVEEVAGIAMIFVTYLGAAMATINNSNTRIDFFIRKLPRKGTLAFEILDNVICIAFLVFICQFAVKLMGKNMGMLTPALKIPIAINYFAILLGSALMILFYLVHLYLDIQKLQGRNMDAIEEELNK